jgi:hypothetical protein
MRNMTNEPPVGFRHRNGRAPSRPTNASSRSRRAVSTDVTLRKCKCSAFEEGLRRLLCHIDPGIERSASRRSKYEYRDLATSFAQKPSRGRICSISCSHVSSPRQASFRGRPTPHVGRPRLFLNGHSAHACFIPPSRRKPEEGQSGRFRKPVARIVTATSCRATGNSILPESRARWRQSSKEASISPTARLRSIRMGIPLEDGVKQRGSCA